MNSQPLKQIKSLAHTYRDEIISIRHHLHSHPELSFEEKNTAEFISSMLKEWNIEHQTGIGGYGIIGVISGTNAKKKCVALRADMDALPISEQNEVEYRSQNEGVMHACGHDVHSAALLGALRILDQLKNEFEGTIKFIFQPGEEKLPGGASLMIKAGVLENPRPDAIIAQHVYTPLSVGTAGFRSGMYMASADEIYITVKGKGGHAAEPGNVINPIFIAARLLVEIEKLINELSKAKVPTVLAFGKISGAGATNVIPSEVTIDGTLRTMDESWRSEVHGRITKLITGFSTLHHNQISLQIGPGYPVLVNDEIITSSSKKFAEEYLGKENVGDLDLRMASEDFSFYSQEIPACFYRIGTGNAGKGITSSVHTPTFNIDEDALEIASGMMAWMAVSLLQNR
ncbi:MAG: M20 family metallopeptidase [Chitinophagales bacterium]